MDEGGGLSFDKLSDQQKEELSFHYEDFTEAQLAALKGEKGETGAKVSEFSVTLAADKWADAAADQDFAYYQVAENEKFLDDGYAYLYTPSGGSRKAYMASGVWFYSAEDGQALACCDSLPEEDIEICILRLEAEST
jgi:hypothetical protein